MASKSAGGLAGRVIAEILGTCMVTFVLAMNSSSVFDGASGLFGIIAWAAAIGAAKTAIVGYFNPAQALYAFVVKSEEWQTVLWLVVAQIGGAFAGNHIGQLVGGDGIMAPSSTRTEVLLGEFVFTALICFASGVDSSADAGHAGVLAAGAAVGATNGLFFNPAVVLASISSMNDLKSGGTPSYIGAELLGAFSAAMIKYLFDKSDGTAKALAQEFVGMLFICFTVSLGGGAKHNIVAVAACMVAVISGIGGTFNPAATLMEMLVKVKKVKEALPIVGVQLGAAFVASYLAKFLNASVPSLPADGNWKVGVKELMFTLLVCLALFEVKAGWCPALAMIAGHTSAGGLNPAIALVKTIPENQFKGMLFPFWAFQFGAGALAAVTLHVLERSKLGVEARESQEKYELLAA